MPTHAPANCGTALPFLEHYLENDGPAQLVLCQHFPFRIGRSETADYVIYSGQVSKIHAVIECGSEGFFLRDLKSTNGTFVNGQRVTQIPLRDGDIIHIAHKEFRFGVMAVPSLPTRGEVDTDPVSKGEPLSIIYGRKALQEVLLNQNVRVVFQPIVDLKTEAIMGYEALGRGTHEQLSQNPAQLFHLAEKCGMARQLSRLFRLVAFREANQFSGDQFCFFNVHPSEMEDQDFANSLSEAAAVNVNDGQRLVMEVHEDCVADVAAMRRLRDRLNTMGIGLAYDDFGAGQARLAELAEVPPDYLKIDMKLIRGIDTAPARQDIVGALIAICSRLGVHVLAEGIETAEEAQCCRSLGCQWGQGFLFGRPVASTKLPPQLRADTRRINVGLVREQLQKRQS